MPPLDLNALFGAIRKTQSDNAALKKGLAELQALLARSGNVPKYVEDLPGTRVQYVGTIDITIAASSTARVEGSYSVSSDGPFIVTGIAMFYQRTSGPYSGHWAPATTVEGRMASATQGVGFGYLFDQPVLGSFDVEFSESGADRNWQNNAWSSALFAPAVGGVYVLPVGAHLGRSAVLIARVTPTVAQLYAGKLQVILLGYKIVQGDSVQP